MKTFLEKFDGPIVLSLLECICADRFAFFCLFFVYFHGGEIFLLELLLETFNNDLDGWRDDKAPENGV